MAVYRTPGVFVEEIQCIPPAVAAVATAIPCFFGYTQNATLAGQPTKIGSLLEFEEKFGGSPVQQIDLTITKTVNPSGALLNVAVSLSAGSLADPVPVEMMHYAVKHYFANGGGPCWIYSLGGHGANVQNAYTTAITALEAVDEPTLLVFPGATRLGGTGHEAVVQAALTSCLNTQDRFTIADVRGSLAGGAHVTAQQIDAGFRTSIAPVDPKALQYGAAYWPYLQTRIPWNTNDDNIRITVYAELVQTGNATAPQNPDPALVTAVGGGAVAISNAAVVNGETAVYNAAKAFAQNQFVTLPPSAAIAGAYATTDRNRGVWKAPANIGMASVVSPALPANNTLNDALNVDPTSGKSVNVIRSFAGRGILVWGARTLAGNDNEYRYVPVRRLTIMIEESIEKAIAAFVFESNDANTWVKVRTMIENFLLTQWRLGALQGQKPEDAFDVQVGLGVTMSADDILNGIMRVRVVIAPVRPAEFIVLTFEQKLPT